MHKWKFVLRKNLLYLILALSAIAGLEAYLQKARPDLHDPTYFQSLGEPLKQYAEDRELFWVHKTNYESMPNLIREAHSKHVVFVFGGSIAVGLAETMQTALRADGLSIDCMNLGCGGYTSYQSLILLKRFLSVRIPEAALVCNGYNDSRPAFMDYRAQAELNGRFSRRALFMMNKSRLFTLYRRFLLKTFAGNSIKDMKPTAQCVPLDQYKDNLREFAKTAKAKGAIPIMVTQAMPNRADELILVPYFQAMEEVAGQTGAAFVDVRPAFAKAMADAGLSQVESYDNEAEFLKAASSLWGDSACHPSVAGYALMGREVMKVMKEKGLWE